MKIIKFTINEEAELQSLSALGIFMDHRHASLSCRPGLGAERTNAPSATFAVSLTLPPPPTGYLACLSKPYYQASKATCGTQQHTESLLRLLAVSSRKLIEVVNLCGVSIQIAGKGSQN